MTAPLITLLTDFGQKDPYVGVMKGVILGICREARIVDVTHDVGAQNIREGNFALRGAAPYFPPGTIHVVVIDPGVGSQRRILVARAAGQIFLAPDNGVLTAVIGADDDVRQVTNAALYLGGRGAAISRTFHGRDIFAPVAARLACGVAFSDLGPPIADPVRLELQEPVLQKDGVLVGRVVHVDSFGNLITNVREKDLTAAGRVVAGVDLLGRTLEAPCESYASASPGRALTIIDSFDHLEIAVRGGSAAAHFNAGVGDEVRVRFAPG